MQPLSGCMHAILRQCCKMRRKGIVYNSAVLVMIGIALVILLVGHGTAGTRSADFQKTETLETTGGPKVSDDQFKLTLRMQPRTPQRYFWTDSQVRVKLCTDAGGETCLAWFAHCAVRGSGASRWRAIFPPSALFFLLVFAGDVETRTFSSFAVYRRALQRGTRRSGMQ